MGCFSVACNLTNQSMYTNESVFIGLVRSPYASVDNNAHMCYYHAVFTPIFLPIYGELNSYGYFDSYTKTKYTDYLENLGINVIGLTRCEVPDSLEFQISGLPKKDFDSLDEDKNTGYFESRKKYTLDTDFYREHRMNNTFKSL